MAKKVIFIHFLLFSDLCDIIFRKGVDTVLKKYKTMIKSAFSVLLISVMLSFPLNSAYAAAFETKKEIPRSFTIIIMIMLFIITTVTAAFFTYKTRIRKIKKSEDNGRSDKTDK